MFKIIAVVIGLFSKKVEQVGISSWYSVRCNGGRTTASGIPFYDNKFTFAHRKMKFGTKARITNLQNGKSVVAVCTDVGPFIKGRFLDVSPICAKQLGFYKAGLAKVKVEIL